MEEEMTTKPKMNELSATITAGPATISARLSPMDEPSSKPPWQKRLKDWGNKALAVAEKVYKIAKIAEWLWEHVPLFSSRRHRHA